MKRGFDFFVSLFVLVLAMPVMLLITLLIRLESKGRALFRQERVGLNGKAFTIYKFRSMVANAEGQGPYFTSKKDPRITPLGRFLRKTSLDELPQLLNVLKGDMSLVGPRPNLLIQREHYTEDEWNKRNSVRPGITGLAQAKLRSAATAEMRTLLDLEYVDKVSFLFDMYVVFLTIQQVLVRREGN